MKHKFLISALVSIMLLNSVGASMSTFSQPVEAVSKHSYHWHWIKTTKNRNVYKFSYPLYKTPKYLGILNKGTRVKTRYWAYHGFYEIAWSKKLHFVIKGRSTNWFVNR